MNDVSVSEGEGDPAAAMERFDLVAADGFRLSAIRWVPKTPRAILQLSHGMSEYAARYAPFAAACAAAGIAVYAHDHRGHGASIDEETPLGFFAAEAGWAKVVGDLRSMHEHVRQEHPGVPIFFFGHSMGSFLGRAYLLAHGGDVAGAVLSSTGWRAGLLNHVLRRVAQRESRKHGPRALSPRMSNLVFGTFNLRFRPARTDFDWLSRDTNAVDAYIADPLCGFPCSAQLWADFFAGLSQVEKAENDPSRLPRAISLLLVAGSHDPVSRGGLGHAQLAKRYRAAGNVDVDDRRYLKARHELVHETNREEVWHDIVDWIRHRS